MKNFMPLLTQIMISNISEKFEEKNTVLHKLLSTYFCEL